MKYFLAAIAFVLAPMSMAVVQPAAAQTVESEQAFAQWMVRVTGVVERASAVNNLLAQFQQSYNPNGDRNSQLAAVRALRGHATQSRPQLAAYGQELEAIGVFQHPGADPELVEFSRTMIADTQIYLRNMDELLSALIAATEAIERNDARAFNAVAPRLMRSASLLLEGQIVMFRGRQRIVPASESSYHGLGAMISLYEGMRAIIMPNVDNRAQQISAAANSATGWSASGRAALAVQRASLMGLTRQQQNVVDQMFALEEQFYVENDRVAALLRAAATDAAAGMDPAQLNSRYTPQVAAIEVEYQRINAQQVALYAQLAQQAQ